MKINFLLGLLGVVVGIGLCMLVLESEHALVFHPKGVVAEEILKLIFTNLAIMFLIIIPTYIFLFIVIWKYCINGKDKEYDPDHTFGFRGELLMWGLPSLVVLILAFVTWEATHRLNPYKPLESDRQPLVVQVVAMDWKWLFIYPEHGIAVLNDLHIPERTPIHFKLAADGSPMNSFWIPQLGGQIYSMTGMTTQLFLMANGPGTYTGRAVEINGEGYADMTFSVKSTSQKEFEDWVALVKKSPHRLTESSYNELVKHSINKSIIYYSEVEPELYKQIIKKYMYHAKPVL